MLSRSLASLFLAAALSGCELFLGSDGTADAGTVAGSDASDASAPDAGPCGNGRIDPGETCDIAIALGSEGACPSTCDDHEACTKDTAIGSGCTASCRFDPITTCHNDDGCCPAGCNALTDTDCPFKRIFVTKGTYNGNLKAAGAAASGIEGGDALCNASARSANLGGAWRAWLSDSTHDAIDRIADVGPWQLLGTWAVVFADKAALQGHPSVQIDHDETGAPVTNAPVWTGTYVGGRIGHLDCFDWISPNTGDFGDIGATNSINNWTDGNSVYCDGQVHLYCLEQ